MGTKKENAIIDFLKTPIKVGDTVAVRGLGSQDKSKMGNVTKVIDLIPNLDGSINITIIEHGCEKIIEQKDYERTTNHIGQNPLSRPNTRIKSLAFDIQNIIGVLNLDLYKKESTYAINGIPIKNVSWNPYIINGSGDFEFYQRDFVWTLEDNQNLIHSIYNNIDCGKILIRHRSWEENENLLKRGITDLSFRDIVDGKQRLNAIRGFIMDEFPDKYGNYYSDLSNSAHGLFNSSHLISYSEIDGEVSDKFVIEQFLQLNFAGVPQSKEHIEYVENINNRIK